MIAKKFLILIQLVFCGVPTIALAAGQNIYINQNYGYRISVPGTATIETDPPPAPQHGFNIVLGKERAISVDASYDSTFLGSTEAAIHDRAGDDGIPNPIKPIKCRIGGLKGERIHAEVNGKNIDLAVAYRPDRQNSSIIYTFELDTNNQTSAEDERLFRKILEKFSLTPLTDK
jgi:hypothetical protein